MKTRALLSAATLATTAVASLALSGLAVAQNAYRCDVNGATVYSEKPCAGGTAVAPTQDSAEQKQRGAEAARQLKADDKAVNKRIDARASSEAKARAAERRAAQKAERAAAAEAKKAKAKKDKETAARRKLLKVKKAPVKKPPTPAASTKPT
jgi:hypothetical protein